MIRPLKLKSNPRIGVISTGSKPAKFRLQKGISNLKRLGFDVSIPSGLRVQGKEISDQERIKNIEWAFSNRQIDMVMASRGGYGSIRILDKIDYNLIKDSQKIFVGFSDITALSLAIYKKTGMVTFSGPMAAASFSKIITKTTKESFLNTLNGIYEKGTEFDLKAMGAKILFKGSAEGPLLGGNLSVLTKLIGTAYLPDFRDSILLVEDINEHPGRLDNFFAQLRLSGLLHKICAAIFGKFSGCFTGSINQQEHKLVELLSDYLKDLGIPAIYNLPYGHVRDSLTLPIGLPVRLDSKKGKLVYLENPVV